MTPNAMNPILMTRTTILRAERAPRRIAMVRDRLAPHHSDRRRHARDRRLHDPRSARERRRCRMVARMEAMHLIESSTMTIEDVAEQVGYQDGTALRKIIKRELGTTPSALRT
jgi:AraC-like DNA-binding protein